MPRRPFLPVAFLVALFLTSCSQSQSGPPLVPAEGMVTLDGKPLADANIMFIPSGDTMGQAGLGKSDASGRFAIARMDDRRPGAAVGSYRVLISKKVNPDGTVFQPRPDQDPMTANYKEALPTLYRDETQSPLTAEVPANGTKSLEFKLNSKAK